ncbi:Endoglucanase 10 [Morus notabilis]|uniref:cellulase n=1 Tax=Morus notabilis TaxID=981085 RepID=W9T2Y3_9ROSA|nr:Endoglucanase 10 [Morus notabilis]
MEMMKMPIPKKSEEETLALILIFVVDGIVKKLWEKHSDEAAISQKYADALQIFMQLFFVQICNSGPRDVSEAKVDLSKGKYDAGDHIKSGFPMAFTHSDDVGDQMDAANQLAPAHDALKWITDFLINAHIYFRECSHCPECYPLGRKEKLK